MPTSTGSPLNLQKPISSEVVDLTVINSNYDTLNSKALSTDATIASVQGSITTLNTTVGASGTVQNAVKATNVAGGLNRQIPYQSAVNTTAFTNTPAALGQVLTAGASTVGWGYATPYKIESGTIAAGSFTSGVSSAVNFTVGFTQAPIVTLTPIHTNTTTAIVPSLNAAATSSSFVARLRTVTNGGAVAATPTGSAVDVQWIAIQINP